MNAKCCNGFTLVELVTTILLVTILAVTVAPRFLGSSQFATVAARDALISDLRRMQQSRLAGQSCRLSVSPSSFSLAIDLSNPDEVNGDNCIQGTNPERYDLDDVSVTLGGDSSFDVLMDNYGRPSGDCADGCDLELEGTETLKVRIMSEGYIYAP